MGPGSWPNPTARGQFGTALRSIATAPGPILYHCTAGKDRTGLMTAIVMAALGVVKGQIYQDFLESNDNLAAENEALLSASCQEVNRSAAAPRR